MIKDLKQQSDRIRFNKHTSHAWNNVRGQELSAGNMRERR
jgi:hypothetical protein